MNCYFCNNNVNYFIDGYHGYNKCSSCKKIYIKKNDVLNFLRRYISFKYPINYNYMKKIINYLDIPNNSVKYISAKDICQNINCRKNCSIFKYKYYNLKFWYCNFSDYYIIDEKNLQKFLKKMILKVKIEVTLKNIRNKVKTLFIEGV